MCEPATGLWDTRWCAVGYKRTRVKGGCLLLQTNKAKEHATRHTNDDKKKHTKKEPSKQSTKSTQTQQENNRKFSYEQSFPSLFNRRTHVRQPALARARAFVFS